jgi:lipopolysaccharide transport system ATP-binding protein
VLPAVKVENLSKQYQLGLTHAGSIRELVNNTAARLFGRRNPATHPRNTDANADVPSHIWALRDVCFEVMPGEAIGIIGRNGAGKSTLLKILSRIAKPTTGRVELRGRVASLLEVGTGFHPELTGRENVYLNGAILGMTKREIRSQLDSIVDFAGVETFIDTPVKRYSSGMTVRLGFAVAAHMSPEILIVDEVLAVGDAEFQKQCMGKMDDVAKSGRTVLLVSHNMVSIRQLTAKTILIEDGTLAFYGDTEEALDRYLGHSRKRSANPNEIAQMKRVRWAGDQSTRFTSARMTRSPVSAHDAIEFEVCVESSRQSDFQIGATLYSSDGTPVAAGYTNILSSIAHKTNHRVGLTMKNPPLAPGHYWFTLGILHGNWELVDAIEEVLHFEVPYDAIAFSGAKQWTSAFGSVQLSIKACHLESSCD